MKFLRNNKGQIRVIEAFFASILMLSVLVLVPSETNVSNLEEATLYMTAQNVLTTLDSDGYLSKLIEAKSWASLGKCLEQSIPATVWFNLTVFDENMTCINEIPICNGGQISERIVATDYVCASVSRNYEIYILRLQLSVVN